MYDEPFGNSPFWTPRVQIVEISHYEIIKRIIWFFLDDWLDLSAIYLVFVLYYFEDEADDELTLSRIDRARSAIAFQTVGIFIVKYIGDEDLRSSRYWMHLVIFCLALAITVEPIVRYWEDKELNSKLTKKLIKLFPWFWTRESQPQLIDSTSESEEETQEKKIVRERRSPSSEPPLPPRTPTGRMGTRAVSTTMRAQSQEFATPTMAQAGKKPAVRTLPQLVAQRNQPRRSPRSKR
ncbi:uncharacterized protein LOC109540914 isoform X1 [Dendroctonus ponderosae]|uniref:uncharacterized protein LOC109540914 isoform X1 n=1 Tax=Dendroctonus ponderosae TaxID=77166 RepID=UPI002035587E|nr:uncharacterized protein LOC109540914 isoform X1 [Dendroctonus ponderosae]